MRTRERLARLLCARHYARHLGMPVGDQMVAALVEIQWTAFLGDAEAVLAELRTPDPAMLAATARMNVGWSDDPAELMPSQAIAIWQAMVDAAAAG